MKRKTKTSAGPMTVCLPRVINRMTLYRQRRGRERRIMAMREICRENLWKNLPKK